MLEISCLILYLLQEKIVSPKLSVRMYGIGNFHFLFSSNIAFLRGWEKIIHFCNDQIKMMRLHSNTIKLIQKAVEI